MHHPWHDVDPTGTDERRLRCVIEIPRGSRAKYEVDKPSGLMKLDRVLSTSVVFPVNYGFIPRTLAPDLDPLDILVFSQIDIPPGTIVEAKVIGLMRMTDRGEVDDKVIAVARKDISVKHIDRLDDLPPHHQAELRVFFEDYKKLEDKVVEVNEFLGLKTALDIIAQCLKAYQEGYASEGRALGQAHN